MAKYQIEFNSLLNRNIYYKHTTFPVVKKNDMSIIISNHLWKYPEAMKEMINYYRHITTVSSIDSKVPVELNDSAEPNLNYKVLNKFYLELVSKYNIPKYLPSAHVNNKIKSIQACINTQVKVSCYLDIGCLDGTITESIGKYFKLNKLQTHGVDIKNTNTSEITFSLYDGCTLPYSDNSFDLITCSMTLHKVTEESLNTFIQEMYRVMKPGGVLILREHTIKNKDQCKLLDIMYDFSEYVWSDNPIEHSKTRTFNYKSRNGWSDLITKNKFMTYKQPKIHQCDVKNYFTYCDSYKKIEITNVYQVYRILPTEMKREKYHRRTNEVKNVIHWGQRKLLLSEIEFLTLYFNKHQHLSKPVYVIYAGSAPGIHILYLANIFPNVHFELYDPRVFSKKLDKCSRINTHRQYFTNETASQWKSIDHPDKAILFISDIRTGDVETMTLLEVEERVKIDNQWQMDWYDIMKPLLSMFKYRLPYDSDGKTPYLYGDIYLGVYAPATSTETRLIVGENADMKIYDNREFEEQLFYFNNYERILNYDNLLYNIPTNQKHGLKNNYDGSSEVLILEQFLRMNTFIGDIESNIIRMVGEISKELSNKKTLFSEQSVKPHKKNDMIHLQKDGYIPKNIELNQKSFDIYVIPKYEYFDKLGYFSKIGL